MRHGATPFVLNDQNIKTNIYIINEHFTLVKITKYFTYDYGGS